MIFPQAQGIQHFVTLLFPSTKLDNPIPELYHYLITSTDTWRIGRKLTDKDDWVLDPFGGVGSAIIAAIKNDRKGIGCDKEKEFLNIAKKRIQDFADGNLKTRPIGKPVFIPTGKEKVSQIPTEWQNGKAEYENSGSLFV